MSSGECRLRNPSDDQSLDVTYSFYVKGQKTGTLSMDKGDSFFDCIVKINNGIPKESEHIANAPCYSISVSLVDIQKQQDEDILLVYTSNFGSAGYRTEDLEFVEGNTLSVIGLSLDFLPGEPVVRLTKSENFSHSEFSVESTFLDQLKYLYGYVGEEDIFRETNNSAYAKYWWRKDNAHISFTWDDIKLGPKVGKLRIRRFARADSTYFGSYPAAAK